MMNQRDLEKRLQDAHKPVVVTGAGVSTLSDVPDYTTMKGLTLKGRQFEAREVLSCPFFQSYPKEFWRWHRKQFLQAIEPNKLHYWIAKQRVPVITQNIDGLHRRAGSDKIVEFHGKADLGICQICQHEIDLKNDEAIFSHAHERSYEDSLAILADHVDTQIVLYGDAIASENLFLAEKWLGTSDLIIVIGSTLQVYPLAGLVLEQDSSKIIWIDKKKNEVASLYPDIDFVQADFRELFEG